MASHMTITVIGEHRVRHGSIMDPSFDDVVVQKAALMYCDLPWGPGNLKYWGTVNHKMTGAAPDQPNHDAFLKRLFVIASKDVRGPVIIEYGVRWEDVLHGYAVAAGFRRLALATASYKGGGKLLPLHVHVFYRPEDRVITTWNIPADYIERVANTTGYDTVKLMAAPFIQHIRPGAYVLDPCCGLGYTAQLAIDSRMKFIGNELNAARLAKTIKRLERSL